jgi:hypothetical protein
MRGSLSGGGGVPIAFTHSRRFRSAKYRLDMVGASSAVFVFQAFGNSFWVRFALCANATRFAVVRSDVGHPSELLIHDRIVGRLIGGPVEEFIVVPACDSVIG